MSVLKKLDAACGRTLRRFANLVTGNYFARLERDVTALKKTVSRLEETNQLLRQMHDKQEYDRLDRFRTRERR